jgi:hypothetical protein
LKFKVVKDRGDRGTRSHEEGVWVKKATAAAAGTPS